MREFRQCSVKVGKYHHSFMLLVCNHCSASWHTWYYIFVIHEYGYQQKFEVRPLPAWLRSKFCVNFSPSHPELRWSDRERGRECIKYHWLRTIIATSNMQLSSWPRLVSIHWDMTWKAPQPPSLVLSMNADFKSWCCSTSRYAPADQRM